MTEMTHDELISDAELSKAISDAEKAELDVQLGEVDLAHNRLDLLDKRLSMNYTLGGGYHLQGSVNNRMLKRFLRATALWHDHDAYGKWEITINSPGGEIFAGQGIFDEIYRHSIRGGGTHEVTMRVRGVAASMAGVILQAADHRLVGRTSQLMIHKPSGAIHGSVEFIEDEVKYLNAANDRLLSLLLMRTDRLDYDTVMSKTRRQDWWIDAMEAADLGLVDGIG